MSESTVPRLHKERAGVLAVGMADLPGMLGISRRTLERERSAGRFPPPDRVIGKRPLWSVATIQRWLEGGGA